MRLNIDCVRDVILWAEHLTSPTRKAIYVNTDIVKELAFMYAAENELPSPSAEQLELLNKYTNEQLVYHIRYCLDAKLLREATGSTAEIIAIDDLTPQGHEFIANIRSDTVFNKTKSVLKKLGIESLQGAVQIAASVTTEIIKASIF